MIKLKSKKEEFELFDELANEWWDENGKFKVLHKIKPLRISYILDQFKNKVINDLDILDLGCGGGLVSEPLSRLGGKVTGIDFVKKNIQTAKKHAITKKLKINYICGDIERIKLKKKYDLIIMFEILEHLDNWENFLLRYIDYLKPKGKIIVSTINRNIISKYSAIFIAENILNWIPKGTHDFNKFITPDEIKNFSKKSKIKFQDFRGLTYNPIDLNWNFSDFKKINYFFTLKN